MSFEIEGRLHKKFETENKTATFQAREFVIEINTNNYMQYIKFQLTQDRCELVDRYNEGDQINVHFDLRGREWNEKYFTNLNAWKIEAAGSAEAPKADPFASEAFPGSTDEPVFDDAASDKATGDDLPF